MCYIKQVHEFEEVNGIDSMLEFCIPPENSSAKSESSPNAEKVLKDSDKTDEKSNLGNVTDTMNTTECDVKTDEINNPLSTADKETSEKCEDGDNSVTNLQSGSDATVEDKLPDKQTSSAEAVDAEPSKQGEQTESNDGTVKSEAMETECASDAPDNVPVSATADVPSTDVQPEGGSSVATDSAMDVDGDEVGSGVDHSKDEKPAGDAPSSAEKDKCSQQETECQAAADVTSTPAEEHETEESSSGDKAEELVVKNTGGADDQKDSAAVEELNRELNKEDTSTVDGNEDKSKSDSKTSESLFNMLTSDEKKQVQGLL